MGILALEITERRPAPTPTPDNDIADLGGCLVNGECPEGVLQARQIPIELRGRDVTPVCCRPKATQRLCPIVWFLIHLAKAITSAGLVDNPCDEGSAPSIVWNGYVGRHLSTRIHSLSPVGFYHLDRSGIRDTIGLFASRFP